MGQEMTTAVREKTETLLAMIHHGLEGIAKLHGEPRHIGAGMRREPGTKGDALFIYCTNPQDGKERPGEIWMPMIMDKRVALLFHTIPAQAEANTEVQAEAASPHFHRKSKHVHAAAALAEAGGR